MKYAELIQPAEPLETVKQIRESATPEAARRDVETFVISDRMAAQLTDVIFPNLRYDQPARNELLDRGEGLRAQAKQPPPPRRGGILGFFGF